MSSAGLLPDFTGFSGDSTSFLGVSTGFSGDAARTGGGGDGRSVWAISRSSGVFVQRQCRSRCKSAAVNPPVRTSAHPPQATKMVATIVAHRSPSESRRVATAQATKAMPRNGIANMGNK